MKLNFEEIRAITVGAIDMQLTEDGYVALHRFSEKQRAYYKETNADYCKKAHSNSCQRLSFKTDATAFSLTYRTEKSTGRTFCFFDLYVDGVMVDHRGSQNCTSDAGTLAYTLPEGWKTVTLYLPLLFETQIKDVTFSDGASVLPNRPKRKMLALGDSITQGYDALYPSQGYVNQVADALDAEPVNQAIGGEIFNPGIVDGDLGFTPDFITVAFGTNDYFKQESREEMERTANEFYRRVRESFPHTKIFAILPIWRGDCHRITKVGTFAQAKEIVRAAAAKLENTVVIDGNTFVPHLPEFFSDKHLHPNDLGFKFYAAALTAALAPYMGEL